MVRRDDINVDYEVPISISILILFAVAYSYLLLNVLDVYQPKENIPDLQGAQWITAGDLAGSGYFRKRFNITTKPTKAYFIVSGTDKLSIYVNENSIGLLHYFGTRPSQIFDITNLLRVGENLIAVRVDSDNLGVAPALAGRIVLSDASQKKSEIWTDQSWRVSRLEDFQKARNATWDSMNYNDLHWLSADIVSSKLRAPILPLSVPEYIYNHLPRGDWIWSGNVRVAVFSNDFMITGSEIKNAWLGVSVMGHYSLVVNGVPVVSQQGTDTVMKLIDIGPYLNLGKNDIWLEVQSDELLPRLLVSGSVITDQGVTELDSTSDWKTSNTSSINNPGQRVPVTVISTIKSDMATTGPSLEYKETALSEILSANKMFRITIISIVVALVTLAAFSLFYRYCRNYLAENKTAFFGLFVRPLVPGFILTAILLLLPFDPGIGNHFLPGFIMLLIVPAVVLFFEVLIIKDMQTGEGR